ncbi:alpha/beta hydrolase (plasmid) [Tistrella bauzanensis]|uniref:Alpha/beta hydrolase n=1 Tax=Tistrella arctica TaxID=3133430 RepID=A0ABU9YNV1_9PROT
MSHEAALPAPESRLVTVDGFALQVRIEGRDTPGRPVLLVIGSALYYARSFPATLRQKMQLVFVDHRGFAPGNHATDPAAYALDRLLGDVEAVRLRLGLGQVAVFGHSGHGFLALEYAKAYPDAVTHVVMACLSPDYSVAAHEAGERHFAETACPHRKALLAANLARLPAAIADDPSRAFISYCLLTGPKAWFDPTFDAARLWAGVETNMAMFDHVWGTVFRDIDITRGLDRLAVPVLLMLGRHDYLVPPAWLWEVVRDRFADLTIRVFEHSAHAPFFEEPDQFDVELVGWLDAHPSLQSD